MLFVIIDDYSRYCPHAQFYPDGKMPRLEHCMRQALAKAGIPQAVYVDRASIHVSRHFRAACAALGIRVILGRGRNPAARGKVERFNQTAQNEVYPELGQVVAREEVKTAEEANAYFWFLGRKAAVLLPQAGHEVPVRATAAVIRFQGGAAGSAPGG